jgi:hypothetical protein
MIRPMQADAIPRTAARRVLAIAFVLASLAACGGGGGDRAGGGTAGQAAPPTTPVPGSAQQVEQRIGDTTVYAVAMPTSTIPAEVAREQGIERRDDLVMLRVSGRRGEGADLGSVPLQVQATVTDLRGQPQALQMKKAVAAGLVDQVGTFEAQLPDTLRFDIRVTTPDGASGTLQLTRDIAAPSS